MPSCIGSVQVEEGQAAFDPTGPMAPNSFEKLCGIKSGKWKESIKVSVQVDGVEKWVKVQELLLALTEA